MPNKIPWWKHEEKMTEVFTKKFWKGVKKTFDEAREGPQPGHNALEGPADASTTSESPAAASDTTHEET